MGHSRRDFLKMMAGAVLTGSQAFGVATASSDMDYLVKRPPRLSDGWRRKGYYVGANYIVYEKGKTQLIFPTSKDAYERWMRAHNHCKAEKPRDKQRRIAIFRHFLYGERWPQ